MALIKTFLMMDVIGQAIYDYHYRLSPGKLLIHNELGKPDEMPVDIYFRDEDEMPEMELMAMNLCQGKVLDIGAGAGSHALILQERDLDVTALEISPLASGVIRDRGVKKVINTNIFEYTFQQFNTLLLLMNGIGLSSNLDGIRTFLKHAKRLLLPGGQLIFDSSDVAYLYKKHKPPTHRYYGEINFRYEYKKQKTPWFSWLYIDQKTLKAIATSEGFLMEVLIVDDHDQFLVRLLSI